MFDGLSDCWSGWEIVGFKVHQNQSVARCESEAEAEAEEEGECSRPVSFEAIACTRRPS